MALIFIIPLALCACSGWSRETRVFSICALSLLLLVEFGFVHLSRFEGTIPWINMRIKAEGSVLIVSLMACLLLLYKSIVSLRHGGGFQAVIQHAEYSSDDEDY